MLTPLATRLHPPGEAETDLKEACQLTALANLSPALTLAGDSSGELTLWAPSGAAEGALATFDLSSIFSEIDILHATPVTLLNLLTPPKFCLLF